MRNTKLLAWDSYEYLHNVFRHQILLDGEVARLFAYNHVGRWALRRVFKHSDPSTEGLMAVNVFFAMGLVRLQITEHMKNCMVFQSMALHVGSERV